MQTLNTPLRVLGALLLVLGLAACGAEGGGEASAHAHTLVDDGATLLDVRTPAEFSSGHVEGAINVPVAQLGERLAEVPEDRPVVVYCQSGGRSASAARLLNERGYEVHDLGAMSNW